VRRDGARVLASAACARHALWRDDPRCRGVSSAGFVCFFPSPACATRPRAEHAARHRLCCPLTRARAGRPRIAAPVDALRQAALRRLRRCVGRSCGVGHAGRWDSRARRHRRRAPPRPQLRRAKGLPLQGRIRPPPAATIASPWAAARIPDAGRLLFALRANYSRASSCAVRRAAPQPEHTSGCV
jgi:hypothetical protein